MNVIQAKALCRQFKVAQAEDHLLKRVFARKYQVINAVTSIDFSIEPGELVGFIGPNGAGKSTTIKMMCGILIPTAGEILVFGEKPYQNRKANALKIGVVFGQRSQLWWDLPLSDTFWLLKKMYHIPDRVYEENLKEFNDFLDLKAFFHQPVRQLSLGQRMRADIAAALLHSPQILFLDEPTIGLDVVVKQQIREYIKKINAQRGTTIILTTHDMKDIEAVCDRIIMIDKGKIVMDMPVKEVIDTFSQEHRITFTFEESPNRIPNIADCVIVSQNEHEVTYSFNRQQIQEGQIILEMANDTSFQGVNIVKPEIDEIIRNIYLKNNRERILK